MSRHVFVCNGYTINPLAVRPVTANTVDHFTAFAKFSKGGKSATIPYPGTFTTEELAHGEARTRALADALAAPSTKIPF